MPLLDHFHPPLAEERSWESFHGSWANEMMAMLNQGLLPPGYFAESQVHFGGRVEVDVATLERDAGQAAETEGGVAVETTAATGVLAMPAVFPDEIEVRIIRVSGGPNLVGAIEFVSPANKDRPATRRAFAAKCAAYVQAGVGLIVIDVVTERHANLHDELIALMDQEERFRFPGGATLYGVAYRPVRTEADGDLIEIRPAALALGEVLPTLPLALRGGPVVTLNLELSYTNTRKRTLL